MVLGFLVVLSRFLDAWAIGRQLMDPCKLPIHIRHVQITLYTFRSWFTRFRNASSPMVQFLSRNQNDDLKGLLFSEKVWKLWCFDKFGLCLHFLMKMPLRKSGISAKARRRHQPCYHSFLCDKSRRELGHQRWVWLNCKWAVKSIRKVKAKALECNIFSMYKKGCACKQGKRRSRYCQKKNSFWILAIFWEDATRQPVAFWYPADVYLTDIKNEEYIWFVSRNKKIVNPKKERRRLDFFSPDEDGNSQSCLYHDVRLHVGIKRIACNISTGSKSTTLRHIKNFLVSIIAWFKLVRVSHISHILHVLWNMKTYIGIIQLLILWDSRIMVCHFSFFWEAVQKVAATKVLFLDYFNDHEGGIKQVLEIKTNPFNSAVLHRWKTSIKATRNV